MICNPYEIVIQGLTSEGRTFRPSDWAERLAGILASFGDDQKLAYHQFVRPMMLDNVRCVAVDKKLEKIQPAVYRFLPWLARRRGVLPGRRLGFGGTEARGLIADWARVGLSNRYAAAGMDADLDADMGRIRAPVHALVLADDWLAPRGSMQALLARMPQAPARIEVMDADRLQAAADHFAWMKRPAAVAEALAEDFSISSPGTIDDRPRLAHTSAP